MIDDRLNEITDRLLSIGCSVSSHDSYQEWFCSECGHDAKAEILAALREAADAARQEAEAEAERLRGELTNLMEAASALLRHDEAADAREGLPRCLEADELIDALAAVQIAAIQLNEK